MLVMFVLPAEYGIDLTGFGGVTGLNRMAGGATKAVALTDIIGGNQTLREAEIPVFGEPTRLPNPAVFQDQKNPASDFSTNIKLQPFEKTEIKAVLEQGKVITYSWKVVGEGMVYVDFHGHNTSFRPDFFVRYKEQEKARGNNGSLTAPFSGEHGWFWLNISAFPVTISLRIVGFHDEVIDYGSL